MARKIGPKIRFEVFKRDNFKCQYCGNSAPDVILHVDHIIPVAEKGSNDLTNLITSCKQCNLGKGARMLDDNTVVEKQRKQMEELNERRQQLKMIVKWREELNKLEDEKVGYIEKRIYQLCGYTLSEHGNGIIKKVIKKYDYTLILDSIEKSAAQYIERDNEGEIIEDSADKFINYIPRICNGITIEQKHPEFREINYIKGIMRNRFNYYDAHKATQMIRDAYEAGVSLEDMKEAAKTAKNWSIFCSVIYDLVQSEGD